MPAVTPIEIIEGIEFSALLQRVNECYFKKRDPLAGSRERADSLIAYAKSVDALVVWIQNFKARALRAEAQVGVLTQQAARLQAEIANLKSPPESVVTTSAQDTSTAIPEKSAKDQLIEILGADIPDFLKAFLEDKEVQVIKLF